MESLTHRIKEALAEVAARGDLEPPPVSDRWNNPEASPGPTEPLAPAGDLEVIASETISTHHDSHSREMLMIDELDATLSAADEELAEHLQSVMDRHAHSRGQIYLLATELCNRVGRLPHPPNQPVAASVRSARMPKIVTNT